ncbi:MAG: hypothetical protein Q4Q23_01400 [Methanobacteriaceae archaeon]|nr:hypothetical protein [Methanobacteriaceae archaeon]
MENEKITYEDFKQFEGAFSKVPAVILKGMVKVNANLVNEFKPLIISKIEKLPENYNQKIDIVLKMSTEELQALMKEAYDISGKKHYQILADPSSEEFIKKNMLEIKKIIESRE